MFKRFKAKREAKKAYKRMVEEHLEEIRNQVLSWNEPLLKDYEIITIDLFNRKPNETKDYQNGFKDGLEEGYIQGYQEALFNSIDQFLNSDLARKHHINKLSAELSNAKRHPEDKIKSDYYTNMNWF